MILFDSIRKTNWTGKGIIVNGQIITASKDADFLSRTYLSKGNSVIKIIGKRRAGNGKITVEIISDDDKILFKKQLVFSKSSWTEYSAGFNVDINHSNVNLRFFREPGTFGSIELGRVIIENKEEAREISSKMNKKDNANIKQSILFIVPYSIYGGAEVYLKNLMSGFDFDNFDVHFAYIGHNQLQTSLESYNITHRIVKTITQLSGMIETINFNYIVYYNRADIYQELRELRLNNKINSKLIEIYHSDFEWPGSLSLIKERDVPELFLQVTESIGKNIDVTFKREILPVGIELDVFSNKYNQKYIDEVNGYFKTIKPIIGTVARISKEKNIEYIVDLAKLMPEYNFLIIGSGPEEATINRRIKDLFVYNIHLCGFKNNIHDYYSTFKAFLLCSKIEGTPISILESMASGIPVFSNMVGGISDILQDNVTGLKISGSPERDCKIIHENIDNKNIVDNALEYVQGRHDSYIVSEKFIKYLADINPFYKYKSDDETIFLKGEYI